MRVPLRASIVLVLGAVLLPARGANAQSVLERTPNLSGGWIGSPGQIYFNFLHRFGQTGPPLRKVTSSPTFFLAAPVHRRAMLGVAYATNSQLVPQIPNEWEFFGRIGVLGEDDGAPLDVAVQGGYNLAAESVDGELSLARRFGPVRVLAAGRAFSNGFAADEARFAIAGGASIEVLSGLALAGDVATLLERDSDIEPLAWSAGIQWALPFTPHTLSLHASSVNTTTLQGASRGAGRIRYGFEFTIPVTLSRYLPRGDEPPVSAPTTDPVAAFEGTADTVRIAIQNLAYETSTVEIPTGTTVIWTNEDPVPHTVTAEDDSFDSGNLQPGESWSRVFTEGGSYPYYCMPHPFMRGTIVVR